MIASPLVAAVLVATAQSAPGPAAVPGLHRIRIERPRDCWVWSVPTPEGRFRPVEYEATSRRPAFETNGVVPSRIEGGPRIRASDPKTLAEVRAVAGVPDEAGGADDASACDSPEPFVVRAAVFVALCLAIPWLLVRGIHPSSRSLES